MNGRPTKFKPEFCAMLIDHMRKGYSFESFSAVIGVSTATLYNWLKVKKKFREAKEIAFDESRLFWERIGIAGTTGNLQGWNVVGWIFNMKNRFNWRDKIETEQHHTITPHDYLMKLIDNAADDDVKD